MTRYVILRKENIKNRKHFLLDFQKIHSQMTGTEGGELKTSHLMLYVLVIYAILLHIILFYIFTY